MRSMSSKDDVSHYVKELTGSDRFILDYLVEEVFEGQPEEIQNFLFKFNEVCILNKRKEEA